MGMYALPDGVFVDAKAFNRLWASSSGYFVKERTTTSALAIAAANSNTATTSPSVGPRVLLALDYASSQSFAGVSTVSGEIVTGGDFAAGGVNWITVGNTVFTVGAANINRATSGLEIYQTVPEGLPAPGTKIQVQFAITNYVGGSIAFDATASEGITADFYVADGGSGDGLTEANPTTFQQAWNVVAEGGSIKLVGDTTLPRNHTWSKNISVVADRGPPDPDPLGDGQGPISCRFQRLYKLIFQSPNLDGSNAIVHMTHVAANKTLTLKNVHCNYNRWPATINDDWITVGLMRRGAFIEGTSTSGLVLDGVEVSHGYGPRGFVPYDPSEKLPEFATPATWNFDVNGLVVATTSGFPGWGDDTWPTRNNCFNAPRFINPRFGSITIKDLYAHDINEFSVLVVPDTIQFYAHDFWVERTIGDFFQFGVERGTDTVNGSIKFERYILLDPIGNAKDNGNPHVDFHQVYTTVTTNTQSNPFRLVNIQTSNGFFGISHRDTRSQAQTHFFQASSDHEVNVFATMEAVEIRNIMGVGGLYKAYEADLNRSLYMRNCQFALPLWWSVSGGGTQPASFAVRKSFKASNGVTTTVEDTMNLLADSIVETIEGDASLLNVNSNATGYHGGVIPHTLVYNDPTDPGPGATFTPSQLFNKYKTIGDYASQGVPYNSLREMLSDPCDWTGERAHISVVDLLNQPGSVQVLSNKFYIHGGNKGDLITLSLPAGLEVQQYGLDRNAIMQPWSTTQTTLTVGQYGQFRATSPVLNDIDSYPVTAGGIDFPWVVAANNTSTYPAVDAAGALWRAGSPSAMGSDSPYGTFAMRAKFGTVGPATTTFFFTPVTSTSGTQGGWMRVSVGSTGLLAVGVYDAAGVQLSNQSMSGQSLFDGNVHDVIMAFDLSQVDPTLGSICVVDGVQRALSTFMWKGGTGKKIGWSRVNGVNRPGFGIAGMPAGFQLHYFLLDVVNHTNPLNSLTRYKFNANKILVNGTGPTGTQPAILLVGNASQINDAVNGDNFGAGAKLVNVGTAVTDVTPGQAAWS